MDSRIERDSMGEMKIPSQYLYGASTQRAVENFPISGLRFDRQFIRMLAILKGTCAEVNQTLGLLDERLAKAIVKASEEIAEGKHDRHFVVDIFQTGSGTSMNMNFNEVAANLANQALGSPVGSKKPVHPNDHVNRGQSSNDVIPTVIHLAAASGVNDLLLPALRTLEKTLKKKVEEFSDIVKTGRTHLQDATPLSLGQEFSGYAGQVRYSIERLRRIMPSLYELAIGGTAVGTGINTHEEFGKSVAESLSQKLNLAFKETDSHFEAQATKDACVNLSGVLKTVAVSLSKIANDIRWLSCGPRCGIGEITIPETQPGSSIMPGKVNPVIPEAVLQVCAQVIGNDTTITHGGLGGVFELNLMMPLIAHNLLQSVTLLTNATTVFESRCVSGIEANVERIEQLVGSSLMLATRLAPVAGYDKAAEIAKKAFKENKTVLEVAEKELGLSREELVKTLDPKTMLSPGKSK